MERVSIDVLYQGMRNKKEKKVSKILEWVIPFIIAAIVAIVLKYFILYKVEVPTGSMIPTINKGDQIYVTKVYNTENIERGEILVFKSDELNDTLIKRVIGLPGDEIEIVHGVVFVNGTKLDEPYVKNQQDYSGKFKVPAGKYLFLGDNRANSGDARKWSNPYIDASKIEAKAQVRVYPFSDFGFVR